MVEQSRSSAVRELAERHTTHLGPLLPVLHAVQDRYGWIARDDVIAVADVLNLSIADVHGVVSFYDHFRTAPPPAHVVQVCRGEACQAVGAETLVADVRGFVAAGFDPTDGRVGDSAGGPSTGPGAGPGEVEIREVFCLGNCALGPSGTVDGRLYGRLTSDRVADLLRAGDRP